MSFFIEEGRCWKNPVLIRIVIPILNKIARLSTHDLMETSIVKHNLPTLNLPSVLNKNNMTGLEYQED